jgi:hypothetical protein
MRWCLILMVIASVSCGKPAAKPPVHKVYPITVMSGDHTTKVSADVPADWNEQLSHAGSPEFHKAPAGMFALFDVLQVSGRGKAQGDFIIQKLFDKGKPERTDKPDGRTWIVDHRPNGAVHGMMLVPAGVGYVAICDTDLGKAQADWLDDIAKVCDTMKVEDAPQGAN